ncbi:development-specific protein s [Stylonychia lemnae]|uniref:Development-specific protein s n=1 Tax=Stylonychia lemnae TaxID=5949 RepID=A0A078ABI8_STYLE|nr:development-specific protein s [Stylonychia lemnae]|eukprot:CDW79549.1 development-specific protein s [Stylonychia lemnae]
MVIPANVVVTIYNNNYQTGESLVLEGPKEISFEGSQLKKWNDNIESMVIKRAADFLKAAGEVDKLRGEWVKRFSTSNGKISSQLTIGITQETSETKSKTFGASLEAAASSGVSFLGSGAEITVTASASASMASEITSSLGTSRTTQSTVECDQASGRQSSLWQWRLRGTKGDKVLLSYDSEDYVCKYGSDYLTPPKCPLGSCSDTECRGSCTMIQQHSRIQLALSTGISKAACDQCSDNVAVFYEKDNFQGIQLQVSPQDKAYVLKNFKLDNKITSFKIGKNVRVVLCLDDSCEACWQQ